MERRASLRVRSVLKAEIRYNDGLMSTPCLVKDLSDYGARLDVSEDIPLPDHFDLYIEKRHKSYRSTIRRRQGREVGVAFRDAIPPAASPQAPAHPATPAPAPQAVDASQGPLAERVAKLEAEVADLRRLLKKIAIALQKPR